MVHGDNRGLVLPPRVAPTQVVIIPIAQNKEGVLDKAYEIKKELEAKGIRVTLDDDTNYSPGWKFNQYEMKGVPLRLEIGPRDIENNVAMIARRDTLSKDSYSLDNIGDTVKNLLDTVHTDMLERARAHRDSKTFTFKDYEEFKRKMIETPGFAKGMWCGEEECEAKIKEDTGVTIRCIPFVQENLGETCQFCGKPAKHMVYLAKAY